MNGVFIKIHEPIHLLRNGHVVIIEHGGIHSFCKGRLLTVGVDIVAFLYICQHSPEVDILTFLLEFLYTPFCPDLGRSIDKYLHLRIRKDSCADVASIHHYSACFSETPLESYKMMSHFRNHRNRRNHAAHFH